MADKDATFVSQDQDPVESPTQVEPVEESSPTRDAQPRDRGTFVPLIFGGAVACALGFFAGQLDYVEQALGLSDGDNEVQAALDNQTAQIAELTQKLEAIPAVEPVDLSSVENALTDLDQNAAVLRDDLEVQSQSIAAFDDRLSDLEKRPMTEGVSAEAMAAYQAELDRMQDDLRGSVDAQKAELAAQLEQLTGGVNASRSEIETLVTAARTSESEAQRQAQMALSRASMVQVLAAVESGAPYSDALAELTSTTGTDAPAALADQAANGTQTLAVLQDEFPPLARAALGAARTDQAADGQGGLLAFVERRLGARSVTPRDGDGADAVLSRAEAALRGGQLDVVLAELQGLPDAARAPLSDWIDRATAREAALRAANELMSTLGTN